MNFYVKELESSDKNCKFLTGLQNSVVWFVWIPVIFRQVACYGCLEIKLDVHCLN